VAIDLVYTWVDGFIASHFVSRNLYSIVHVKSKDNTTMRWRDHDELRYSLRSADANATFFRHIYVVCADGQQPSWLKVNSRISVVPHSAIIPSQYLPTFSSSVIESFIHRIPGLSDLFVYANDDFMFMNAVSREDFFEENLPIMYLDDELSPSGEPLKSDSGHVAGKRNANFMLDLAFGPTQRRNVYHFPLGFNKHACEAAWTRFGTQLRVSSRNRFRSLGDVAFTNHLVPHLMLHQGDAVERSSNGLGLMIHFHQSRLKNILVSWLKYGGRLPEFRARHQLTTHNSYKFSVLDGDEITLRNILDPIFPTASQFEKL